MRIGEEIFRDQVIVVKNLSRLFILGVAMQRTNRMGKGYSTDGRHFITVKGEVIAHSCHSTIGEPIIKTKGKVIVKLNSISVIAVKTPRIPDTNTLYEVDSKFQLPKGIILLDVLHRVDHKMSRELDINVLNTSSNSCQAAKIHS